MKKISKIIAYIIVYLIIMIELIVIYSINWFQKTWDDIAFATVVFQLKSPLKGTSTELLRSYFKSAVCKMVITILFIFVIYLLYRQILKKLELAVDFSFVSKRRSIVIDSKLYRKARVVFFLLLIFVLGIKTENRLKNIGLFQYIQTVNNKSELLENYYVDPMSVDISFPKDKRNLLFVYLESMESTYASIEEGGGKDINYIPNLTKLAYQNVNFSNSEKMGGIYPSVGSGWTIAALLASTSGIPYNIPGDGNSAEKYEHLLPGMTNMGDILKKNGYNNYFLCGSDATFGGRRTFFEDHGDYKILDYWYAIDKGYIPEDYYEFWGYEDYRLFDIAKKELSDIANNEEPFNFTMLTVDTHHNNGYVCSKCEDEYEEQFSNVISCSDRMTYEFISWVQQQEWYKNTTIVIVGDHRSMTSDYWDDIGDYERRIYNCFINMPSEVDIANVKNREVNTMDIFPTTLKALGANIEGERLGLGTDAFSSKPTLAEELGNGYLDGQLGSYSQYYMDNFLE